MFSLFGEKKRKERGGRKGIRRGYRVWLESFCFRRFGYSSGGGNSGFLEFRIEFGFGGGVVEFAVIGSVVE